MNLADLADRHLRAGNGDALALRWRSGDGRKRDYSYADLSRLSDVLAARLRAQGLKPGEAIGVMTGRQPETVIAALAIWKMGGIYCPLFADLGPDPLLARLKVANVRLLMTCRRAYAKSVETLAGQIDFLSDIWVLGEAFEALLAGSPDSSEPAADAGILHFTSGTTAPISGGSGQPRAILHDSKVLSRLIASGTLSTGMRAGDLVWTSGEPGWVVHSAFGIIVPFAAGAATLMDEAPCSPTRSLTVLEEEPVDIWYTTPTVIRCLMGAGSAVARASRHRKLRLVASVGEPLSPDAVAWGKDCLGLAFRDNWWQTETGGVVLAHPLDAEPLPGSMGRPLPGVTVRLAERTETGFTLLPDDGMATGELAVAMEGLAPWRTLGGEAGVPSDDVDGWHLTHDIARRDEAGNFWFLGRSDDVINRAGRMVGPFEIEAVLMGHPAVAEAGVVGIPDPSHHERIIAFVGLNPGFEPGHALREELNDFAVEHLGKGLAPDELVFEANLPRTGSGKIVRSRLKVKIAETGS